MNINMFLTILAITFAISFVLSIIFSKIGKKYGFTGRDNFKSTHPEISLLGGYAITISTFIGLTLFILAGFYSFKQYLSLIFSLIIILIIGFLDDYFPDLPGFFKPVSAFLAGFPFIIYHIYNPNLVIFDKIIFHLPIVYPLLILLAFAVVPNSVNMLDVINGSAATGVLFVLISVVIEYYIRFSKVAFLAYLFISILIGFLILNLYPARIFLGNTGSLLLGYYIVVSAFLYRVEFLSLIAMFPFIHNSFFYLNKVKNFVEHKKLGVKVTIFNDKSGLIYDACDDAAPITLLRFLVSRTPKTEKESYISMVFMFILSSLLSIFTVIVWG